MVLSQAKKVTSHVFVIEVSILPLTTTLIIDFRIVPTAWYFRIVLTAWYFRIVPTAWYFRIVPTAWYFMFFILLPQQNRLLAIYSSFTESVYLTAELL